MDIEFFGANCIRLTSKKASLVVDDNLPHIGGKSITRATDVTIATQEILAVASSDQLAIRTPGEYEIMGVSVVGVAARAHTDQPGQKTATMYKFIADDRHILVTGHVYPELDDAQLEVIGRVDIIIIPVGGNGYTLDPLGALKIIRKIEPTIVVPTQYTVPGLTYEVPALSLDDALQNLAMQPKDEPIEKLKNKDLTAGDATQLVLVQSYK